MIYTNVGKGSLRKRSLLATGDLMEVDKDLGTHDLRLKNNYVSVTPIHFDLTDYEAYKK